MYISIKKINIFTLPPSCLNQIIYNLVNRHEPTVFASFFLNQYSKNVPVYINNLIHTYSINATILYYKNFVKITRVFNAQEKPYKS